MFAWIFKPVVSNPSSAEDGPPSATLNHGFSRSPAFLAFSGTPERGTWGAYQGRGSHMPPVSSLPAMGLAMGPNTSITEQNIDLIGDEGYEVTSNATALRKGIFDSTHPPTPTDIEHVSQDKEKAKLLDSAMNLSSSYPKFFVLIALFALAIGFFVGRLSHDVDRNSVAGVIDRLISVLSAFFYIIGVVVGRLVNAYKRGYALGVEHA